MKQHFRSQKTRKDMIIYQAAKTKIVLKKAPEPYHAVRNDELRIVIITF